MKASILSLLAVLCLVSSTFALGTMYINQIRGNDNQLSVNVELVNFKASTVKLDRMFGLNSPGGKSEGTYIEDSELVRGSFFIPHNLIVDNVATISGALHFDGSLHADAFPLAGDSFTVEDNSGTTTVLGVTNPNGGINVNKGLFTVEVFTGRTTIASALLRPNGDTVVGASLFKVSAKDGAVTTKGEVDVQRDVVLGTSTSEDRYITRVASTSTNNPGKTGAERRLVIQSQDGVNAGGNLVLEPGYSTSSGTALSAGAILFGRGNAATSDILTLTRPTVTGTNAGTTTWAGQSGTIGGDLFLNSGASNAGSAASKLVLQVGTNLNGSGYGQLFLGNQAAGADITIRRSSLRYAADGTRTYFRGQSVGPTAAGSNGGRLLLKAGDSFSDRRPGSIVLVPGSNGLGARGRVKIGDAVTIVPLPNDPPTTVAADLAWSTSQQGTQLFVTRQPTASDAGQQANTNNGNPFPLSTASRTNFQGQSSRHASGGSIEFRAGNSATNRFDLLDIKGADLYLTNGKDFNAATTVLSTIVRRIYWGRDSQPLVVKRDINYVADATSTTIRGQTSISAAAGSRRGGNFFYIAGAGTIRSGDILLQAPDSTGKGLGGSSANPSGIVTVQTASHVFLAASGITGANSVGGNVIVNAGQGRANGGNIELTVVPSTAAAIQPTVITDNVFVPATTLAGGLPFRTYSQNQALAYNFVNTDPIGTGGSAVPASGAVPATFFTGYVIATSLSSFKTEEVDFQVNQPATTKPSPVFSLRRDPTANNKLYNLNTATGTNTISRPCNFLNTVAPAGAANADAYCFTTPAFNPATPSIFFMQLTIPRSTFPAVAVPVTTYLAAGAGAYNSLDQPAFHHVFRYSSNIVPGANFDTIIAPRYDGVAFSMSDTVVGKNSLFRMNAVPRFSTMYPALWRYTLFDPQVTAGAQGGQPQPAIFSTFAGGSNSGVRIPPYNINPSPANGRITSNTNAAIPTGLGNAALGNLYAKSKTVQSFRGIVFDVALNLNRVICALHNIGYVQAYERPWKTAVGANPNPSVVNVAIPPNKRCDPTPTRLLRFLQIDPAANALFYGNKFVAPTYSS